jgi:hypothetical protein
LWTARIIRSTLADAMIEAALATPPLLEAAADSR